jgi:hypothetical protein
MIAGREGCPANQRTGSPLGIAWNAARGRFRLLQTLSAKPHFRKLWQHVSTGVRQIAWFAASLNK